MVMGALTGEASERKQPSPSRLAFRDPRRDVSVSHASAQRHGHGGRVGGTTPTPARTYKLSLFSRAPTASSGWTRTRAGRRRTGAEGGGRGRPTAIVVGAGLMTGLGKRACRGPTHGEWQRNAGGECEDHGRVLRSGPIDWACTWGAGRPEPWLAVAKQAREYNLDGHGSMGLGCSCWSLYTHARARTIAPSVALKGPGKCLVNRVPVEFDRSAGPEGGCIAVRCTHTDRQRHTTEY
jgi:hypothetical protein